MKLVIDIPNNFNLENEINTVSNSVIRKALKNGTPLSKHCGILIDTTNLITKIQLATGCSFLTAQEIINKSVVIVSATKEGESE